MLSHFSRVRLFATPWTVAYQAPLSMGFSRQQYWSRVPFLLQGIFPTQGSNPYHLCPLPCQMDTRATWVCKWGPAQAACPSPITTWGSPAPAGRSGQLSTCQIRLWSAESKIRGVALLPAAHHHTEAEQRTRDVQGRTSNHKSLLFSHRSKSVRKMDAFKNPGSHW